MRKYFVLGFSLVSILILNGCETTNSIPYKASIGNVTYLQESLKEKNVKVRVGTFNMAPGEKSEIQCRLMGPVKVAPGKTLPEYIREALQEELFLAQVYSSDASTIINATIDRLSFSSVTPAYWDISMTISSNRSDGYQVNSKYVFNTSFSAYSACKNVADAFSPAVQNLLETAILNPRFKELIGN